VKKPVVQPVPAPEPFNKNLSDLRMLPSEGYHVYSWSPGKVGENMPSTEVHLAIPVMIGGARVEIMMRLKSARALDELVAVLLQHRADVWGKK
jgi:hypothetical protein